MRIPGFLILGVFLLAARLPAGALAWDRLKVEIAATPGQSELAATFPFRNQSGGSVTLGAVTPGCGCTTANLTKKIYAPGESGEIAIAYKIGDRMGKQSVTITVETEDPKDRYHLTLLVDIPTLVTIEPRLVFWNTGDTATEKSIYVSAGGPANVKLISARADNAEIETRIEEIEAGRKYRLQVRPLKRGGELNTAIQAEVHIDGVGSRTYSAAVYLK